MVLAHVAENKRVPFMIPLLLTDDVIINTLETNLKSYLETHTYIECKNRENASVVFNNYLKYALLCGVILRYCYLFYLCRNLPRTGF